MIYHNGDQDELYGYVKCLLEHPEQQRQFGAEAYQTIHQMWNAKNAAKRLLALVEQIQLRGQCGLYEEGPCSRAPVIWNNWFKG